MASYKEQFIVGNVSSEFLAEETSDNKKLSDILDQELVPSLEEYNSRMNAVVGLLCNTYEDKNSIGRTPYSDSNFEEIGEEEIPPQKDTHDVWQKPVPIRRFGSRVQLTLEALKLMSSKQLIRLHDSKMVADRKNMIKLLFSAACKSTPTAFVDALDKKATTPVAFWNDETSMDTPRSNGQITFDGDHNHYLYVATANTVVEADLDTLIERVTEHENMTGQSILWAQPGTTGNYIRDESNFTAVTAYAELLPLIAQNKGYTNTGVVQALVQSAKIVSANIKIVGTWKSAIVIESPDMPANYIMHTMYNGPDSVYNPIAKREHPQFKGLILYEPNGGNPLIGQKAQYRRWLGLGVNDRSAGAVLYTASNSAYTDPTFT